MFIISTAAFLRPNEPTVHITSKRYFLRQGAVDNGIKVYSNAANVTLTLNGQKVSTLANGQYIIPNGPWVLHPDGKRNSSAVEPAPAADAPRPYEPEKVDNVFYWPVPLRTGKNVVTATDDRGHSDTATIYFYGKDGLPETAARRAAHPRPGEQQPRQSRLLHGHARPGAVADLLRPRFHGRQLLEHAPARTGKCLVDRAATGDETGP